MPFLFPLPHNWSSPFKVDVGYKTEIIQSRVFREQRLAQRSQPRKQVTLSVSPSRGTLRTFLAQMAARQQAEWVLPEVTRAAETASPAVAGGSVLDLGVAAPVWAVPGSYVVIEALAGQVLAGVVSTLGGGVLIDVPLAADLPTGSRVYPGLVGRLDQSLKGSLQTNTVGNLTIVFAADPGLNQFEDVVGAPLAFNGRELFVMRPNWQSSPQITLDGMLETTDYDRGRLAHHSPVAWNIETLRMEFIRRNAAEAELLTQFFHRMRGQQGEFYMPTWTDDFDLTTGAASGASILNVPGTTMFDLFGTSTVYKAAFILYKDGTYQANRITARSIVSGSSRFTFATPFSQAVNEANVKQMCWLPAWRLSIDSLTLEWLTRTVAQAQLTARTIEDLA